jgi:hypothetical protein
MMMTAKGGLGALKFGVGGLLKGAGSESRVLAERRLNEDISVRNGWIGGVEEKKRKSVIVQVKYVPFFILDECNTGFSLKIDAVPGENWL